MHTRDLVPAARDRAIDFLLQQQSADGRWIDWALPPGPSEAWTTAYVALQLAACSPDQRARVWPAVMRAAQWILTHACKTGGWSYNDTVDADADSTAWSITLLRAAGFERGDASDRLACFQQPDGGFATFPADAGLGSWGRSHPDVTAVAVNALVDEPSKEHVCEGALQYLRAQRRSDGLWNAFWWTTSLYTTAICLRLLARIAPTDDGSTTSAALQRMPVGNAFDAALLLECLVHVQDVAASRGLSSPAAEDRIPALLEMLIARQLGDGSWPAAPMLRITDRTCDAPWRQPECGPVYADDRRLFTSATVLRALNAVANTRSGQARALDQARD